MFKFANWSLLRLALLAGWFGLPLALLREVGLLLIPYAALLGYLATRITTPRLPAQFIVAGNVLWVVGSVALLVSGLVAPTVLGTAFVIAQALVVAILAELQLLGLRRQRLAAA